MRSAATSTSKLKRSYPAINLRVIFQQVAVVPLHGVHCVSQPLCHPESINAPYKAIAGERMPHQVEVRLPPDARSPAPAGHELVKALFGFKPILELPRLLFRLNHPGVGEAVRKLSLDEATEAVG